MTIEKSFAEKLNGREYRSEITDSECKYALDNNLLVIFGASDDLIEFRGAIESEMNSYQISNFFLLKAEDDFRIISEYEWDELQSYVQDYGIIIPHKVIKSYWSGGESKYCFSYSMSFPHENFNIMEDGEFYCQGVVINLNKVSL